MGALALRDAMAGGRLKAVEVAEAFIARVHEREAEVQAFEHFDESFVMRQAEAADRYRGTGRPLGLLHGVPVGLKDIIDTRDLPTESGTVIDKGRRPSADAAIVERLKEAGAVLMGKTVTTELAVFTPGKTRNPHDPSRTPGGSSSGSAAAVAAGMVPLAVGTQTNGSVIRPASFCGVVGFKPTRGLISRRGVTPQSSTLDQVGVFAASVEDVALLTDALIGNDDRDPGMVMTTRAEVGPLAMSAPPVRPDLAFIASPVWEKASPEMREGLEELLEALGGRVGRLALPESFADAHRWHRTVNMAELAFNYARYYDAGRELLSDRLRAMVEEGRSVLATDYQAALASIGRLSADLDPLFDRYDALITPAAPGEAPVGMATGDPVFSTIWTFCGLPAASLPVLTGPNGMPMGVQLVGRGMNDGRLLRTARWLAAELRNPHPQSERREATA